MFQSGDSPNFAIKMQKQWNTNKTSLSQLNPSKQKSLFRASTLSPLYLIIYSHPLKTIFQHKACTNKLYADSFYKVQKNSHSSFEVICCRS